MSLRSGGNGVVGNGHDYDDTASVHSVSSHSSTSRFLPGGSRYGRKGHGGVDGSDGGEVGGHGNVATFGTVDGVFLPCVQTILGVILFLRLTSITAQAGVIQTTLIVLMCTTSTLPTALSLSALATNGTVRAGGPYYVISRTLGPEIGGALGLLFYVGTTGSAAMMVLGAVETVQAAFDWHLDEEAGWRTQAACLIITMALCGIVGLGGEHQVNRSSNFFLGCVLLSVLSMLVGAALFSAGLFDGDLSDIDRVAMDSVWPNYEPDVITGVTPTLFSQVALFYPSVTGILAGSNRSAVLADPARSIPSGTLGAIAATTAVYLCTVWLFGCSIANDTLKDNRLVVAMVGYPSGDLVMVGIVMSSVGAALQCVAGAPRLLAAIALDDNVPFLRFVKPPDDRVEPTRAIWVTWLAASAMTMSGNLDRITPLITMFFLIMYGGINLSCFFLGILKAPGFRPTFRYFHWTISLFGFAWCLGLAFMISWYTALTAFVMFFAIYLYNKRQQLKAKNWGDVGNALRYNVITLLLRQLAGTSTHDEDFHAKNWRPQVLALVDMDRRVSHLRDGDGNGNGNGNGSSNGAHTTTAVGEPVNLFVLRLAAQLDRGRGLNMVFGVLRDEDGDGTGLADPDAAAAVRRSREVLRDRMRRERMDGFEEVVLCSSSSSSSSSSSYAVNDRSKADAVWSAVVHSGLGPLSPNTVLLSWPDCFSPVAHWTSPEEYVSTLKGIANLRKALLLFKGSDRYPCDTDLVPAGSTVDVWWIVHDGGLLLLLPYLLSRNDVWRRARLRLFAVVTSGTENPHSLRRAVVDHLARVRIRADVEVVDLGHTDVAEDMRSPDRRWTDHDRQTTEHADVAEVDTQHSTVGEVFGDAVYDVPYRPVDDLESAIGRELGLLSSSSSSTTTTATSPPAPAGPRDDDDDDDDEFGVTSGYNRRRNTAAAFNASLRRYSSSASLVVTNLPLIWSSDYETFLSSSGGEARKEWARQFVEYVDVMTEGLDNVLLVRGSGAEVITTYA